MDTGKETLLFIGLLAMALIRTWALIMGHYDRSFFGYKGPPIDKEGRAKPYLHRLVF